MVTKERYDEAEESTSFIANIRRNLNVVTINEYMELFLAGLAVFLLSGLVYVLAQTPDIVISNKYGTILIFNTPLNPQSTAKFNMGGISHEFVLEMIIVAILIAGGSIGLYMIKNATSYIDDQRTALQILLIGSIIFLISAALLFFVYMYKISGNFPYFAGLA